MKKIRVMLVILIVIIVLACVCGIIVLYRSNLPEENTLTFCLRRTDGVSHWYYELSNTNILKETASEAYYNIGSTYSYWEFSATGLVLSDIITAHKGTWGCPPGMVETTFEHFFTNNDFDNLNIKKYDTISSGKRRVEELIITSLKKDIPVIFMTNYFSNVTCECEYDSTPSKLNTHYVTITGIKIDEITGDTVLIFSTWSDRATARLNDFYLDFFQGSTVFIIDKEI